MPLLCLGFFESVPAPANKEMKNVMNDKDMARECARIKRFAVFMS